MQWERQQNDGRGERAETEKRTQLCQRDGRTQDQDCEHYSKMSESRGANCREEGIAGLVFLYVWFLDCGKTKQSLQCSYGNHKSGNSNVIITIRIDFFVQPKVQRGSTKNSEDRGQWWCCCLVSLIYWALLSLYSYTPLDGSSQFFFLFLVVSSFTSTWTNKATGVGGGSLFSIQPLWLFYWTCILGSI